MKLSIIIPTNNNEDKLEECLETIYNQTLSKKEYEVIVVNDGSTDNTSKVLKKLRKEYPFILIEQDNLGPAAARNAGIKKAKNEIIVFIQDDIMVSKHFLQEHLNFHEKYDRDNTCVVGFTTWHLDLDITPFMYWLEHGGPQFDYDRIKGKEVVDYMLFYTSNLSIRNKFIKKHGMFDENFKVAGTTAYEDTELGFRLSKQGLKIYYNKKAKAWHKHPKTLSNVLIRQRGMGKMSHLLYKKHPDFKPSGEIESVWHRLTHLKTGFLSDKIRFKLTRFVINPITVWPLEKLAYLIEDRVNIPILYKIVCGYWYSKGYREGLQ